MEHSCSAHGSKRQAFNMLVLRQVLPNHIRFTAGDPRVSASSETYVIRQDLSQDQHIEGLPLGTVGGTGVLHNFPVDAGYVFQAKLYRTNLNIVRGLESPHEVEFTVDGQRVHIATIGGREDLEALFQKPTDTGDAVEARLKFRAPVK